ncbi:hypothetical protein B0H14DRAFT_1048513 [Mycena olivaceomarginata]|nr:hypothetical protein B0H14DRAFT_1048513 [Mycena olivaceomarginata]
MHAHGRANPFNTYRGTSLVHIERLSTRDYSILGMIARLCVDRRGILPPSMLFNLGNFAESLQRFQSFLQTQNDQGKIRRLLKTQENSARLENCKIDLQQAVDIFSLQAGPGFFSAAANFDAGVEQSARQKELIDLILATKDDEHSSDCSSSTSKNSRFSFGGSSVSLLSLLPPSPKIFHGREEELQQVVTTLLSPSCIAIMGTGGVGKTSLAIAALHHPASISKYPRRFFVSCESTSSEFDLVAAIGSTIGLEPSTITLYAILRTLSSHDLALLVLDNVETVWEPMDSERY